MHARMNLRIHRLAIAEIDHEVDYYESRQAEFGTDLEYGIDAAFTTPYQIRRHRPAPRCEARQIKRMLDSTFAVIVCRIN